MKASRFTGSILGMAWMFLASAQARPPIAGSAVPSGRTIVLQDTLSRGRGAEQPGLATVGEVLRVSVRPRLDEVWVSAENGRPAWVLEVSAPGASGVRVHFRDFDVGSGTVWVSAAQAGTP